MSGTIGILCPKLLNNQISESLRQFQRKPSNLQYFDEFRTCVEGLLLEFDHRGKRLIIKETIISDDRCEISFMLKYPHKNDWRKCKINLCNISPSELKVFSGYCAKDFQLKR